MSRCRRINFVAFFSLFLYSNSVQLLVVVAFFVCFSLFWFCYYCIFNTVWAIFRCCLFHVCVSPLPIVFALSFSFLLVSLRFVAHRSYCAYLFDSCFVHPVLVAFRVIYLFITRWMLRASQFLARDCTHRENNMVEKEAAKYLFRFFFRFHNEHTQPLVLILYRSRSVCLSHLSEHMHCQQLTASYAAKFVDAFFLLFFCCSTS